MSATSDPRINGSDPGPNRLGEPPVTPCARLTQVSCLQVRPRPSMPRGSRGEAGLGEPSAPAEIRDLRLNVAGRRRGLAFALTDLAAATVAVPIALVLLSLVSNVETDQLSQFWSNLTGGLALSPLGTGRVRHLRLLSVRSPVAQSELLPRDQGPGVCRRHGLRAGVGGRALGPPGMGDPRAGGLADGGSRARRHPVDHGGTSRAAGHAAGDQRQPHRPRRQGRADGADRGVPRAPKGQPGHRTCHRSGQGRARRPRTIRDASECSRTCPGSARSTTWSGSSSASRPPPRRRRSPS